MSANPHVVVIGLDGVPPWLLQRLMDEGDMPRLAQLCQRGVFGRMRSTVNRVTPSAWTTMTTGVNPGRHGLFHFLQYLPQDHDVRVANSQDRRAGAIWDLLATINEQAAILRLPMTFPTMPMNGMMVGDHTSPSIWHDEFVWPRELRAELIRKFGILGWLTKAAVGPAGSYRKLRYLMQQFRKGISLSFGLVHYALDRGDHRLIFAVSPETDAALHKTLPLLVPGGDHAGAFSSFPDRAADHVIDLFRFIDDQLGPIIDRLGNDTNIVLVSDHGMGCNDPGGDLLRPLLIALGYQAWRQRPPAQAGAHSLLQLLRSVKSKIGSYIPWQIRRLLLPLSQQRQHRGARAQGIDVIDYPSTRAFTVFPATGCGAGGIWLNTKQRSALATVPPDKEQQLVQELTQVLEGVMNADTGEPQIEGLYRREQFVHGPYSDRAPDLLAVFRTDRHCKRLQARAPGGSTVTVDRSSLGAWGITLPASHTPYGFFMAAGPDVAHQPHHLDCNIADVMPTLAYLCHCPIPRGLDGRLLTEIIRPETLSQRPPAQTDPLETTPESEWEGYSDKEAEDIERRLSDLGYI